MAVRRKKLSLLLQDLTLLEKYSEDLFNFLPLPTLLSSPLSVILEFNPSFEDISGFRLDEVVGKHIDVLFGEKTAKLLINEAKEKGKVENKEVFLLSKNKEKIPVSVFIKARIFEDEIAGFFLSVFDLREVKKMEEKLREVETVLRIRVMARTRTLRELTDSLEEEVKRRTQELAKEVKILEKFQRLTAGRVVRLEELRKRNKKLKQELFSLQHSSK